MNMKGLMNMAQRTGGGAGGGSASSGRGLGGAVFSAFALGGLAFFGYNSLFTVQPGQRAVLWNRISGVKPDVYADGMHLRIPLLDYPAIYDIRSKPKMIKSPTGTRDLQMVEVGLRILYKPDAAKLPIIHKTLGQNYDDRIMPSIANETVKSVIAYFNASQLITQRSDVSQRIKENLIERAAGFNIIIDDVSITSLNFGTEYMAAIEAKQVAQQEAERAKFLVKQALQDKKSTIIKAQGEAQSASMIGQAMRENPGYIELRQLDAAKAISETISKSQNKVYLDSESLLLNILALSDSGDRLDIKKKK